MTTNTYTPLPVFASACIIVICCRYHCRGWLRCFPRSNELLFFCLATTAIPLAPRISSPVSKRARNHSRQIHTFAHISKQERKPQAENRPTHGPFLLSSSIILLPSRHPAL